MTARCKGKGTRAKGKGAEFLPRSPFPLSLFPSPFSTRGMVLFEVMIALSVFALAAFSLVVALDGCLDAAHERNHIDLAMHGLENQMALLHGTNVQVGETDAPDDGTGVAYHVSIAQEQDLRDEKGLPIASTYRATLTATWKSPNGSLETRSVSELIYQP